MVRACWMFHDVKGPIVIKHEITLSSLHSFKLVLDISSLLRMFASLLRSSVHFCVWPVPILHMCQYSLQVPIGILHPDQRTLTNIVMASAEVLVSMPGAAAFNPSDEWFGIEVDESHDNVPMMHLMISRESNA